MAKRGTFAVCGTPAGRRAHRVRRALSPLAREVDRWWTRTQDRAWLRLTREYPERYAELLAEERALDPDPRLISTATTQERQ